MKIATNNKLLNTINISGSKQNSIENLELQKKDTKFQIKWRKRIKNIFMIMIR